VNGGPKRPVVTEVTNGDRGTGIPDNERCPDRPTAENRIARAEVPQISQLPI
jgi:hypothetical protein